MLSSRLRSRPLDLNKPLEIVRENDDDILEDAVAYREVSGTGSQMLAEEEQEKHLQDNLEKRSIIPIPGVTILKDYEKEFLPDFKLPAEYITVPKRRPDIIDYDADESDEEFIEIVNQKIGQSITVGQFELLIDIFEKKSELSNSDFNCDEAIRVVSCIDEQLEIFVEVIFPYWKKKRKKELNGTLLVKLPDPKATNGKRTGRKDKEKGGSDRTRNPRKKKNMTVMEKKFSQNHFHMNDQRKLPTQSNMTVIPPPSTTSMVKKQPAIRTMIRPPNNNNNIPNNYPNNNLTNNNNNLNYNNSTHNNLNNNNININNNTDNTPPTQPITFGSFEQLRQDLLRARKLLDLIEKREQIKLQRNQIQLRLLDLLSKSNGNHLTIINNSHPYQNGKIENGFKLNSTTTTHHKNNNNLLTQKRKRDHTDHEPEIHNNKLTHKSSPQCKPFYSYKNSKNHFLPSLDYNVSFHIEDPPKPQISKTQPSHIDNSEAFLTGSLPDPNIPFMISKNGTESGYIVPLEYDNNNDDDDNDDEVDSLPANLPPSPRPLYCGRRRIGRGGRIWWDRVRLHKEIKQQHQNTHQKSSNSQTIEKPPPILLKEDPNIIPKKEIKVENSTEKSPSLNQSKSSNRLSGKWILPNMSLYNWKNRDKANL